jgi:hypothetical protein
MLLAIPPLAWTLRARPPVPQGAAAAAGAATTRVS